MAPACTSFDWTYPTNYVTPVREQGSCGSCWAFATTAALESYTLLKDRYPGQDLNLSGQDRAGPVPFFFLVKGGGPDYIRSVSRLLHRH